MNSVSFTDKNYSLVTDWNFEMWKYLRLYRLEPQRAILGKIIPGWCVTIEFAPQGPWDELTVSELQRFCTNVVYNVPQDVLLPPILPVGKSDEVVL